jgi:STE24 endopeptidase
MAERVLAPSEPVPEPLPVELSEHFSSAEVARGRAYARPQRRLGLAAGAIDAAALTAVVRWSAHRARAGTPVMPRAGAPVAAAGGALLSLVLTVPSLPITAVARRRSLAVGLATQSWGDWGRDLVKAAAIQSGLAAFASAAVSAAARRWPEGWWAPVAGGSVMLGAGLAALAPVVLDPVFNDFTPLEEGPVRSDVLELAQRAGVKVGQVFSVDASRRTTAANAYVTGLGPTKRVVLFDTLLDRFSREEVNVVVAHELAHVRHRDVTRGLGFAALSAPGATLAAQRLSWLLSPERATTGALPALALAAGLISAPLGVISGRLSRALERRADAFSLRLSDAPEAFVSFERTIALQNVADLDPPWIVKRLSTHPPTVERIGMALAYQNNRRALARP